MTSRLRAVAVSLPRYGWRWVCTLCTCVVLGTLLWSPSAHAEGQTSLSVHTRGPAPTGFDRNRLLERIRLYLADIGTHIEITWGQHIATDFALELSWHSPDKLTPFSATLREADGSQAPRSFLVEQTNDWDAFERLLALKLRSELRAALETRAQREQREPQPPALPLEPMPRPLRVFPQLELGGGAALRNNEELVPEATIALWIGEPFIGAGTRVSLSLPTQTAQGTTETEIFDNSVVAFLRLQAVESGSFGLFVELDGGVFASRISSVRLGAKRDTWLVSPIFSAKLFAGYRLSSAALILGGPYVSVLSSRERVFAAGESVYDSGYFRPGLQLAFGMEL